jgi:alpha-ketoglutarate-dependent taurine dioxygenase
VLSQATQLQIPMPLSEIAVDYAAGVDTVACTIARALPTATVVRIRPGGAPPANPKSFWAAVAAGLGEIDYPIADGHSAVTPGDPWWDIRYDPESAKVYRHSATAQPLHTDRAFRARPATGEMFYCERQASEGGATIFLDAEKLCAVMAADAPDLLAELRARQVHFARGDAPGQTVSVLGERNGRPVLNWNRYRIAPGQDPSVYAMGDRFFAYLRDRFEATGELLRVRLNEGEALIFKDQRLLHGREAFAANPGRPRTIQTLGLWLRPELE